MNNALAFLVTPVGTTTGLTKGIEVPVTPATYNLCPAVGVAEYATIIGTAFVVGTLVNTTSSHNTDGNCVYVPAVVLVVTVLKDAVNGFRFETLTLPDIY
jgi:hypothetical protein